LIPLNKNTSSELLKCVILTKMVLLKLVKFMNVL
jgi:hypothetical protein